MNLNGAKYFSVDSGSAYILPGELGVSDVALDTMRNCNVPLRKPTWRIMDGKSTESLALTVALDKGVKPETVARASQLLDDM